MDSIISSMDINMASSHGSSRSDPVPCMPSPQHRPMNCELPSLLPGLLPGDPAQSLLLYDPTAPLETTACVYSSKCQTHPDTSVSAESWTFPVPPLSRAYSTPDKGISAINGFAQPHGYAVTVLRSNVSEEGVKQTVHLICEHARKGKQEDHAPMKESHTRALSCQFTATLRPDLATGNWRLTVQNTTHSHGPSVASTHPVHRTRELLQQEDFIIAALRQGRAVSQILTDIREANPESCLIPRDFCNIRWKLRD